MSGPQYGNGNMGNMGPGGPGGPGSRMPMMGGNMNMMPMNQMGMGGMGYQGMPSMGPMGPSHMMGPSGGMQMGGPQGQFMGGPRMMNPGMGMGGGGGGPGSGPPGGGGGGPRMMGPGPGPGPSMGMGGRPSMGSAGSGAPPPEMSSLGPSGPAAGMGMGSPGVMSGSPGNVVGPTTGAGPGPTIATNNTTTDGAAIGGTSGSSQNAMEHIQPAVSSPAPQPASQQQQQSKDVNTSTVCRIGQETVEEIVSRTQEVFSILKSLQPPVGSFNQQTQQHDKSNQEKQSRLQDVLKGIAMLFKRLRVCWEKCQEHTGGMDFMPIESLIPLKEEGETGRVELEKKRGDAYKAAVEEHNDLVQQIIVKNRHLKDVIDQMRNIIWEINTMLAIRKN